MFENGETPLMIPVGEIEVRSIGEKNDIRFFLLLNKTYFFNDINNIILLNKLK